MARSKLLNNVASRLEGTWTWLVCVRWWLGWWADQRVTTDHWLAALSAVWRWCARSSALL